MKYDVKKAKSGIHIKPENKGKFTATKKKTGKTTEELTHSKNPVTRKRAIFAQNAAKWHHKTGGTIDFLQPAIDKFKSGGEIQYKQAIENNVYRKPNYSKAKCGKKLTKKVEKKQAGGIQLASNTQETSGQRAQRLNRLKLIAKRDQQAGVTQSAYNSGETPPVVEKYFNPSMLHQMRVMAQNNGKMPIYKMPKGTKEPTLGCLPGNISPATGTCAGNASRGGAVDNWGTGGTKLIKRAKGGKLDITKILSTWKK